MPAQISRCGLRPQAPQIAVFANKVVDPSRLAAPGRVLPRTAHGRDVLEPRNFRGNFFQLLAVAKLPGAAATLQTVKFVVPRHLAGSLSPIFVKGAYITDERRDARDGRQQQMLRSPAAQIQGKAPLG